MSSDVPSPGLQRGAGDDPVTPTFLTGPSSNDVHDLTDIDSDSETDDDDGDSETDVDDDDSQGDDIVTDTHATPVPSSQPRRRHAPDPVTEIDNRPTRRRRVATDLPQQLEGTESGSMPSSPMPVLPPSARTATTHVHF